MARCPAPVQFSRSTSGNLEVTTERRRKAQAGAPTYRRRCRRGKARAVTKGSRLPRLSALCRDLGLKSRLTPSLHCPNKLQKRRHAAGRGREQTCRSVQELRLRSQQENAAKHQQRRKRSARLSPTTARGFGIPRIPHLVRRRREYESAEALVHQPELWTPDNQPPAHQLPQTRRILRVDDAIFGEPHEQEALLTSAGPPRRVVVVRRSFQNFRHRVIVAQVIACTPLQPQILADPAEFGLHPAFLPHAGQCFSDSVFHRDRKSTRLNSSHLGISYA